MNNMNENSNINSFNSKLNNKPWNSGIVGDSTENNKNIINNTINPMSPLKNKAFDPTISIKKNDYLNNNNNINSGNINVLDHIISKSPMKSTIDNKETDNSNKFFNNNLNELKSIQNTNNNNNNNNDLGFGIVSRRKKNPDGTVNNNIVDSNSTNIFQKSTYGNFGNVSNHGSNSSVTNNPSNINLDSLLQSSKFYILINNILQLFVFG